MKTQRLFSLLFLIIFFISGLYGQKLETTSDSIYWYADIMNYTSDFKHRQLAHIELSEILIKKAKSDTSFQSLESDYPGVKIRYAEDSLFRIVSWQLINDEDQGRFYGLFQLKGQSPIKLHDQSAQIGIPEKGRFYSNRWIGVVYNDIIKYGSIEDSTFMLIGSGVVNKGQWKHIAESMKIEDGKPVFGIDAFHKKEETLDRISLSFTAASGVSMKFMEEKDLLIYDKLTSVQNPRTGQQSNVPVGTYEGFKLKDGKWKYVEYATPVSSDKRKNPAKFNDKRKKERDLFRGNQN